MAWVIPNESDGYAHPVDVDIANVICHQRLFDRSGRDVSCYEDTRALIVNEGSSSLVFACIQTQVVVCVVQIPIS